MPVDAIPGDIEDAVLEPFDRNVAGSERRVLDLGEGLHPVDALGLFRPETIAVPGRGRIKGIGRRPAGARPASSAITIAFSDNQRNRKSGSLARSTVSVNRSPHIVG